MSGAQREAAVRHCATEANNGSLIFNELMSADQCPMKLSACFDNQHLSQDIDPIYVISPPVQCLCYVYQGCLNHSSAYYVVAWRKCYQIFPDASMPTFRCYSQTWVVCSMSGPGECTSQTIQTTDYNNERCLESDFSTFAYLDVSVQPDVHIFRRHVAL
jgi:hypothetical protein